MSHREAAVFRFLDDDGHPVVERNLDELLLRAQRIAAQLIGRANLVAGDRVVLVYLPSLDFVEALLACLLVGIVPAALLPPDPAGSDVARLRRVVDNAGAKALLTHRAYHRARMFGRLGSLARLAPRAAWPELSWVVTDARRHASLHEPRLPAPGELAFLQYTSGSTGAPRGVRVSHANLAHNLDFITRLAEYRSHSRFVWWVPQYHDFGLIAGIFAALWCGCSLSLLSPFSFLRRPAVWPEALSRFRATHTTSPNFGLELLMRKSKPEQRAAWDLSALERLGLGGEPIVGHTVTRFERAMKVTGLRPGKVVGAYGLAEHVAAISVSGTGRIEVDPTVLRREGRLQPSDAPGARLLVSSGSFGEHVRVRIVDPDEAELMPDGHVGEIWASSPSVVEGYEGEPRPPDFEARLPEDDGHRYLRTGDLGAVLDGQLYVTGRIKELIIIRGQNVYPTDIEHAVNKAHPSVRAGRVAAFGTTTDQGTEQLVIMAELRERLHPDSWPEIVGAIRAATRADVPAGAGGVVVLGRRGLVSKTTSGKVQRGVAEHSFHQPGFRARPEVLLVDFPSLTKTEPALATTTRDAVHAALSRALGRPIQANDLQRSPAELGLDSMQVTELQAALEQSLGTPISLEELLAAPTVADLAARVAGQTGRDATPLRVFLRRYKPAQPYRSAGVPPCLEFTAPEDAPRGSTALLWRPDPAAGVFELIEQARTLSKRQERAELRVLAQGAVAARTGELPQRSLAALWGFCRSLHSEAPHQRWQLIDSDGGPGLEAALAHPAQELALRDGALLAPGMEPWEPGSTAAEHSLPFGGAGLVVGSAGAATRRALLWLVRERGVTELVLLSTRDEGDGDLDSRLASEGVRVRRVSGSISSTAVLEAACKQARTELSWGILVAEHHRSLPAGRQTRGRVEAAMGSSLEAMQALAAACPPGARLLAMSDATGWLGPPRRAAWAAGCAALEAEVLHLRSRDRAVTHIMSGPWRNEVSTAELRCSWAPVGLGVPANGDELPLLESLLASGGPTCAGLLPGSLGDPG